MIKISRLRILVILIVIGLLTWYGKAHRPAGTPVRKHGTLCWVTTSPHGLGSYVVLGDDGIDSNQARTGLRIWLNPPRHPQELEVKNHARYRGPRLILVGDSLESQVLTETAAMVDTGGILRVIGSQFQKESLIRQAQTHARFEFIPAQGQFDWLGSLAGRDVTAQLELTDSASARNYTFLLLWNGFRARFWSSRELALADPVPDSISVGVIAECMDTTQVVPHALNGKVRTLIYCGKTQKGLDSTRISLEGDSAGVIFVEDLSTNRILAKKVHLAWNSRVQ